MATIYDMSMLMIAETILETFGPLSEKNTIPVRPANTDLQKTPIVEDNDDDLMDLDLDPLPIDDSESDEALVSFAAPLDYYFLNDSKENGPISDARSVQTEVTSNTSSSSSSSHQNLPTKPRRIRAKRKPFPKTKNDIALDYRKNDVLLGRGGHASSNPGNLYLLHCVRESQAEYKSLGKTEQDKVQKRAIVQKIVSQMVARGSRFLYREKKGVEWREASSQAVYDKISHMLRD